MSSKTILSFALLFLVGYLCGVVRSEAVCQPTSELLQNPTEETKLYVFKKNQNCFQEIKPNATQEDVFNPKWPTKFFINIRKAKVSSDINQIIKNATTELGDFNVVLIDWNTLIKDANFGDLFQVSEEAVKLIYDFATAMYPERIAYLDDMILIDDSVSEVIAAQIPLEEETKE